MNIKGISLITSALTISIAAALINTAQASTVFDNISLTEVSRLLGSSSKSSLPKKSKHSRNKRRVTCDSFSQKTLYDKAKKYRSDINNASIAHGVSPSLIMAVITVESCFRSKARSSQGAAGLMQLMPATARRFGTKDRYNSTDNINAGTRYLRFLLTRFNGNVELAAAAYNAGEGAVDRHNGVPPYKETQAYVVKVLKTYRKLAHLPTQQRRKPKVKAKAAVVANRKQPLPKKVKSLVFSLPEWKQINTLLETKDKDAQLSLQQFL